MLRITPALHIRWMLYHRQALGGKRWSGRYGAVGKFYGRTGMADEVKGTEPITLVDRKMMSCMHTNKLRHFQLARSYHEKMYSTRRKHASGEMLRRRVHRKVQKAFIAFMQFKIKQTLEEQAKLVNTFGQTAVNTALGNPAADAPERQAKQWAVINRKVKSLPTIPTSPRHIATMRQIQPDRFDRRWRQN